MTSTTKARAGLRPARAFNTSGTSRSHPFQPSAIERNPLMVSDQSNPDEYAVGQFVYCQHGSWPVRRTGVVVAYVPPAAASGHDYPAWIVAYPPSTDEHPAVQALAIYGGAHRGLFTADELEPVPADDAPPATDAEVVAHLTGVLPDVDHGPALADGVDAYACPVVGCDYIAGAVGPVDPDEPDLFSEELAAHRRWHELQAVDVEEHPTTGAGHDDSTPVNHGWGDVRTVDLWRAVRPPSSLLDWLPVDLPPTDVARVLRDVANVLDGGAK